VGGLAKLIDGEEVQEFGLQLRPSHHHDLRQNLLAAWGRQVLPFLAGL
jgi:hypothetical protein